MTEPLPDIENVNTDNLQNRISYICKKLADYWKKCNRTQSRFMEKHSAWLDVVEACNLSRIRSSQHMQDVSEEEAQPSTSTAGRPLKDFSESSKRSQRRRLAKLSAVDDSAVNVLLRKSDRSTFSQANPDDILSLIVEAKLTKHQYLLVKSFVNSRTSSDLMPSYKKVLNAKKQCYPSEITVTESSAEVALQNLLDHTANRILESQKNVLENISPQLLGNMVLIGKWGFDGSTGHSEYKQKFLDSNIEDDSSLFVTSYVPLQLICRSDIPDSGDIIIWKNPRPSSTRYCRPIRFQFAKETTELSVQTEAYFKDKINNLQPCISKFNDREVRVQYSLQLTMVDGKVCNALSETASSRCYICGASPKEMNDIDKCLKKPADKSRYEFGLSPLHSWIRFFEYFIHLSYRLPLKKWQIRSAEDKALFAQRKKSIQAQFKERLGLIVDKPRSGGSGTSNDGNTARTFFAYSATCAEITGLDKNIIDRCGTLLSCLSSGYNINKEKFRDFALDTARQLIQEYPWYNLPPSVHKVLIHGYEVIDYALLSIGELSEEAAESTNKVIKLFRRDHTRKMSRVVTNTDLLHSLLLNSDPLITSLRILPRKKQSLLSQTVISLLNVY